MLNCYVLSPSILVFDGIADKSSTESVAPLTFLAIQQHCTLYEDFIDIVPTANSITLYLRDPKRREFWRNYILEHYLKFEYQRADATVHCVPTRYGGAYGTDLAALSTLLSQSVDEIIMQHSAFEYMVSFMGFLPGFGYLTGLPPALHVPRKAVPSTKVPSGSVAIAEALSAIYPSASPGGWHVIGQTDLKLFDPNSTHPCLFKPGDIVRFEALND
ncbi:5-oxoprolinase subunit PxpB [Pseudoalteromonas xiamenensis]|uniref:5-oxoprolinase subunit PxpB n=1 Tax=Pseudoalteromonas xiamenensis TaxID=882626 RepID=UPI0027E497AC|nr:5-oxoprolinase subunit PxpB [Pseudoalteromonas xiamenensis]WMN59876.1 5-oxoprolinase subunit PxpB [Pseudoalteromonas xiamenensis]